MPVLPIESRRAQYSASAIAYVSERRNTSNSSTHTPTSAAKINSTLDTLQLKVKNTFLEVDSDEGEENACLRDTRRVQTCSARFADVATDLKTEVETESN